MARKRTLSLDVEKFRVYLQYGFDFFSDLGNHDPSEEDVREAWRILGPAIMAEFAADTHKSGQRPFGWWMCAQDFDHRPDRGEQRDFLEAHHLLTEEEQRVLIERDRTAYPEMEDSAINRRWLYENGYRR